MGYVFLSGIDLVSCGSGTSAETPSDAELLRSLEARESAALERLHLRHARYALGIAWRILGDREEAETVVRDVFDRIWTRQIQYDPRHGNFPTWLFSVSRDSALDRLRLLTRRPDDHPIGAVHHITACADPDVEVDTNMRRQILDIALNQLPSRERQAIQLSFYQGMTHSEIARTTGEPRGVVKHRIAKAVARLRTTLVGPGVGA